jgi:long-chain acyl-CoA synthetase
MAESVTNTNDHSVADAIAAARQNNAITQTINVDQYPHLLAMLDATIKRYRDLPAFSSFGQTISYGELDKLSKQFADYLHHHLHVSTGDRIAIQLPNVIQYPVVLFGAMRAGMIIVNTNPLYTPHEIEHQLVDSGATVLVVLANVAHNAAQIIAKTPVKKVIVTELADLNPAPKRWLINAVVRYVKRLVPDFSFPDAISFRKTLHLGSAGNCPTLSLDANSIAVLQYTGGTTGVAKGAMLSHRNLMANALQGEEMFTSYGFREGEEVMLLPLPLYHIYSFTLSMVMLIGGNHCVLIPNPRDINSLINDMKNYPMTAFSGLNTLFVALMKSPEFQRIDFTRLKMTLSGGMALTQNAALQWQRIVGSAIFEGYGLTETSPVVSVNPGTGNQIGTIGVALSGTEIKIIGDDKQSMPVGERGELYVRGPQVMLGYWQRPEATREILNEEGWLATGDIAIVQPNGYIRIVDRKKDLIIVSGFNVYPNEVEDVVAKHPDVLECAVIGVPNDKTGEAVKLFVVSKTAGLTAKELMDFCHNELTGYKIPHQIEFRKELPKSNVGKILRKDLRAEELHKIAKG